MEDQDDYFAGKSASVYNQGILSNLMSGCNKYLLLILISMLFVLGFLGYKYIQKQNNLSQLNFSEFESETEMLKQSKIANIDTYQFWKAKKGSESQDGFIISTYTGTIKSADDSKFKNSLMSFEYTDNRQIDLILSYPSEIKDRFAAYERSSDTSTEPISPNDLSQFITPGRKFILEERFNPSAPTYEQSVISAVINFL